MRVTLSPGHRIAADLGTLLRRAVAFAGMVPSSLGELIAFFLAVGFADAAFRFVQPEDDWPQPSLVSAEEIQVAVFADETAFVQNELRSS